MPGRFPCDDRCIRPWFPRFVEPLGDSGGEGVDRVPVAEVAFRGADRDHDRLLAEREKIAVEPAGEHPMLGSA
jgi:hypothetical protein